ncbi:MAG: enoyl-CoA hydratase [Thermoleophilaceae bacterium]|nr:enoyl-CoA hydratase [Thermoleophilaceae bacterium]
MLVDEPASHVARIKISNSGKRGALDHEILDALTELVNGQTARCLLITGDGPVFSAGYDIGTFDDDEFSRQAESLVAHPFTAAIEAIEAYPFPVVAAVNGHAIGGGLELAVTCDIRIAARGVKLGMPPAKIGLIYSHTGLRKFMEVCGVANTNELFLLGRNVDADRACGMGLVNLVVDGDELEARAVEFAAEIAANAPLSLEGNKRVVRELRQNGWPLPEALERELVELRESCFFSEDFREGIRAFGEKRKPVWRGR